jgi:hypothetical protein
MSLDTNLAGIQVNALVTPQSPIALTAVVTTANSTYTDTPTNAVEFLPASGAAISAAAPRGMRLTRVSALARATPTATELQLYVSDSANTVKRFIKSVLMPAYTVAQTTAQAVTDFGYSDSSPLILQAGERLWLATGVTNTGIVGRAEGGAY